MITFHELDIDTGYEPAIHDSAQSIMIRGSEPFMHLNLVDIIFELRRAGVARIGVRTDGGALSNPQTARGCIDAGVRVFEILVLAGDAATADRISGTQGLHAASLRGITQVGEAATELDVHTFMVAVIPMTKSNAGQLIAATQAAIAAGAQAIRIECDDVSLLDSSALDIAHTLATRSSVAFFGDGCGDFIEGAALYEVRS